MLTHLSEYHRPSDLAEALDLLGRSDIVTVPLAGGTWLIPAGVRDAQAVVDLRDLTLDQVEVTADGLRLGATVTLQTVIDDPRTATFAGGSLAEAARHSAPHNIRADEMPQVERIIVPTVDPAGPFGAKSIAEIPTDGVAPAVVNAIYNATGVWLRELPATPERVWRALREG